MKNILRLSLLALAFIACDKEKEEPQDKVQDLRDKIWQFETVTASGQWRAVGDELQAIKEAQLPTTKSESTDLFSLDKFTLSFKGDGLQGGKIIAALIDPEVPQKFEVGRWSRLGESLDSISVKYEDNEPSPTGKVFYDKILNRYLDNFFVIDKPYTFVLSRVGSNLEMEMALKGVGTPAKVDKDFLGKGVHSDFREGRFDVVSFKVNQTFKLAN